MHYRPSSAAQRASLPSPNRSSAQPSARYSPTRNRFLFSSYALDYLTANLCILLAPAKHLAHRARQPLSMSGLPPPPPRRSLSPRRGNGFYNGPPPRDDRRYDGPPPPRRGGGGNERDRFDSPRGPPPRGMDGGERGGRMMYDDRREGPPMYDRGPPPPPREDRGGPHWDDRRGMPPGPPGPMGGYSRGGPPYERRSRSPEGETWCRWSLSRSS